MGVWEWGGGTTSHCVSVCLCVCVWGGGGFQARGVGRHMYICVYGSNQRSMAQDPVLYINSTKDARGEFSVC